jgi:hypothetical protein
MIVRINQIDVAAAEPAAGWDPGTPSGGFEFTWPLRTFAYQISVLDHDEKSHPLSRAFRQTQVRQLVPQVIAALADVEQDEVVVRLDGSLADGELLAAFRSLVDPLTCERYAIAETQKLNPQPDAVPTSVRLLPLPTVIAAMCADPQLGLGRSVRLRAIAVPERLVNPLLDTTDVDDERWRDILPHATFVLSTAADLLSLLVWTPKFDPTEIRRRVTQRLAGSSDRTA